MKLLKCLIILMMLGVPLCAKCQTDSDASLQSKVDSLMSIANKYYMWGQLAISIEYYDKALILKPDFAKAFYNRGNTYFDLGINNKACDDWEHAKLLGSKEADLQHWKFCE
jgi:tetratricopeptide (TPR) repeat protein